MNPSPWDSKKKIYRIWVTQEEAQTLFNQVQDHSSRKILKTAFASTEWSARLLERVTSILQARGLKSRISVEDTQTLEKSKVRSMREKRTTSYPEFLLNLYDWVQGNTDWSWVESPGSPTTLSYRDAFERLHYDRRADAVTGSSETYRVSDSVLLPQATPILLQTPLPNVCMITPVFRREHRDRTHLCSFLQLDVRVLARGGNLEVLKELLLRLFHGMGLDPSKIEYRPTNYHYVAPGIQVFYRTQRGYVQLAGGGVLLESVRRDYGLPSCEDSVTLAAGIGLDRVYSLITGKSLDSL